MERKLKIPKPKAWGWHRSGWGLASRVMREELHSDDGVLALMSEERFLVDALVREEPVIPEPFVLFSHLCPFKVKHNQRWQKWNLPALAQRKKWKQSLPKCRGIWCLSEHAAAWLRNAYPHIPVSVVYHPSEAIAWKFQFKAFENNSRKHLVTLGQFYRRLGSLIRLDAPAGFIKAYMPGDYDGMRAELQSRKWARSKWPKVLKYLDNDRFDRFLTRNLVFLDVYDASANNGVLDCLVRHTPILVCEHPAIREYLGNGYPLCFNNLSDAAVKLRDRGRLRAAHEHLGQPHLHDRVHLGKFAQRVADSDVYAAL